MMTTEYKFHEDGTLPKNGEVFVFGSNLAGIHGAGAAKVAVERFGATYGNGQGWQRDYKSYAIPTKGMDLRFALPLEVIANDIDMFVRQTKNDFMVYKGKHIQYFVTRIGCGFAGYKDEEIAPLFRGARNCSFAEEWRPYLENVNENRS